MLATVRTEELVLAVNELTSNSIRYGGGSGWLRVWREGGTLMCEVRDAGHLTAPQLGRACPDVSQPSGRGLWLVDHLCDEIHIRSSRAGTTVRVHKHLS
jgi:anti-sigma regulatory factor (Ser/Thr protein kinase)